MTFSRLQKLLLRKKTKIPVMNTEREPISLRKTPKNRKMTPKVKRNRRRFDY